MDDHKLTIKINFQGKDEVEKLLNAIGQKYNIKIDSNIGQINAELKNMDKSLKGMYSGLKTHLGQFGFMMQGLAQFKKIADVVITDGIKAAQEQARSINLIDGAIKATGGSAKITSSELQRMASDLQKVSNFSSNEILSKVSNVLLIFRNIQGDVFKQAQKSVLDLATAMGTDLHSASMQLGKALDDPIEGINALSRAGTRFSDAQKEQIKNFMEVNKLAEAQGVILDELSKSFSGQAKNVADPFIQLNNALSDFKQAIGGGLLPMLNNVAKSMTAIVTSITPVKSEFDKVSKSAFEQQSEFRLLIHTYEKLRFEQNQSVNDNMVLKDTIDKLNSKYGTFLGNIDLATVRYDQFRTAVSKATDELVREATAKIVLAQQEDKLTKIGELQKKRIDDIHKQREFITKLEKNEVDKHEQLLSLQNQYKISLVPAFVPAIEQAGRAYNDAINRVESAKKKLEEMELNEPKNLTQKRNELEQFRDKYHELLSSIVKPEADSEANIIGSGNSTIMNSFDKDLEALKKRLMERRQAIETQYEADVKLLEASKNMNTKYTEDMKALKDRYDTDIRGLDKEDLDENLRLNELKVQVGKYSTDQLLADYKDYSKEMARLYGQDSKEYMEAVNKMAEANTRHTAEARKNAEDWWRLCLQANELGVIEHATLEDSKKKLIDMLTEARSKVAENTEEWTRLGVQIAQVNQQYDDLSKAHNTMNISFGTALREMIDQMEGWNDAFKSIVETTGNTMANELGRGFNRAMFEGKNFGKEMKSAFKNMGIAAVQEINRIIARMLVLKVIGAFTGGGLGFSELLNKAVGFASGGYTGDGRKFEPAGIVHRGEYVVNQERTSLFRSLLDTINYGPASALKNIISIKTAMPVLNIPNTPSITYASGGFVNGGLDFSKLEYLMSEMNNRLVDGFGRLERKDYDVKVVTNFRGVEFIREFNKAKQEYDRRID